MGLSREASLLLFCSAESYGKQGWGDTAAGATSIPQLPLVCVSVTGPVRKGRERGRGA